MTEISIVHRSDNSTEDEFLFKKLNTDTEDKPDINDIEKKIDYNLLKFPESRPEQTRIVKLIDDPYQKLKFKKVPIHAILKGIDRLTGNENANQISTDYSNSGIRRSYKLAKDIILMIAFYEHEILKIKTSTIMKILDVRDNKTIRKKLWKMEEHGLIIILDKRHGEWELKLNWEKYDLNDSMNVNSTNIEFDTWFLAPIQHFQRYDLYPVEFKILTLLALCRNFKTKLISMSPTKISDILNIKTKHVKCYLLKLQKKEIIENYNSEIDDWYFKFVGDY